MNISLFNDEQILNEGFRKKIIAEINGTENVERKRRAAACWEIWRDQVRGFVLDRLKAQGFLPETLAVMNQRASNVNLFKKIVSKKARSYSKGVDRSVPDDQTATKDIEVVATEMDLTGAMKKADRYRKAARNCLVYIYPEMKQDPADATKMAMGLCTKVFFPHLYDAIPDAKDKEKMRCFILSPFADDAALSSSPALNGGDGRGVMNSSNPYWRRDHMNQVIANHPRDDGAPTTDGKPKREYVFWTAKYHLTCDENGAVIPAKSGDAVQAAAGNELGYRNPIGILPAFICTEEQDGEFWALGGDDSVEATILINLKLTDMESILHMQGWGQLVVEGEALEKKDFAVGPQKVMLMETAKGATVPTKASILQHDPHTDDHLKSVEVHVALTLTTNNLSIKSVSTNLEAGSVASAIAKMVDESENMDDISEDQEYYGKKEKEALRIAEAWLVPLRPTNVVAPELKATKPLKVKEMVTQFHNQEQVITEAERLANLKMRKELGLDTLVDLIKRDNPGMSDKQAEAKALQIMNERVELEKKRIESGGQPAPNQPPKPGEKPADGEKPQDEKDDEEKDPEAGEEDPAKD